MNVKLKSVGGIGSRSRSICSDKLMILQYVVCFVISIFHLASTFPLYFPFIHFPFTNELVSRFRLDSDNASDGLTIVDLAMAIVRWLHTHDQQNVTFHDQFHDEHIQHKTKINSCSSSKSESGFSRSHNFRTF